MKNPIQISTIFFLTENECKEILVACRSFSSGNYRELAGVRLLDILKNESNTNAFKATMAVLRRLAKKILESGRMDRSDAQYVSEIHRKVFERLQNQRGASSLSKDAELNHELLESNSGSVDDFIRVVYELTVGRSCGEDDVSIWKRNFSDGISEAQFLLLMYGSEEARAYRRNKDIFPDANNAVFVQLVYEIFEKRGAIPSEINHWTKLLDENMVSRQAVVFDFLSRAKENKNPASINHDAGAFQVMGSEKIVTKKEWDSRLAEVNAEIDDAALAQLRCRNYKYSSSGTVAVSIITSLYRGGQHIRRFLENITSQVGFSEFCELIIVDANSPDGEFSVIKEFQGIYKNIKYIHIPYRVGIYDAWNIGIENSHGEFITNANLDDLRDFNSISSQAGCLQKLKFVDIVYQDFYYTFDPDLAIASIRRAGFKTDLPNVSFSSLLNYNSPHNAPMWRRSLHDCVGMFDTQYKSAGDYEFWVRCFIEGKCFFKLNDPTVIYFQNPNGISTRPDSRGAQEARDILRRYATEIIPTDFTLAEADFLKRIGGSDGLLGMNIPRYELISYMMRNLSARSFGKI